MKGFIDILALDATKGSVLRTTTRYQHNKQLNSLHNTPNPITTVLNPSSPVQQIEKSPVQEKDEPPQNIYSKGKYMRTQKKNEPDKKETPSKDEEITTPTQKFSRKPAQTTSRTVTEETKTQKVSQQKSGSSRIRNPRQSKQSQQVEKSEQTPHISHFNRKHGRTHQLHHHEDSAAVTTSTQKSTDQEKKTPVKNIYSKTNQSKVQETTVIDTTVTQTTVIKVETFERASSGRKQNYGINQKQQKAEKEEKVSEPSEKLTYGIGKQLQPVNISTELPADKAPKSERQEIHKKESISAKQSDKKADSRNSPAKPDREQTQESKSKIRSNILIHALSKYHNRNISFSWSQIKQQQTVQSSKNNIFGKILAQSAVHISNSYENNLKAQFFKKSKAIAIKKNSEASKQILKSNQTLFLAQKNSICSFLDLLFKSRIRSTLTKLKNRKEKELFISKGLVGLAFFERKKKVYFKILKQNGIEKQKAIERNVSAIAPIINALYIRKFRTAFEKLIRNDLPSLKPVSGSRVKNRKSNNSEGAQMHESPSQSDFMPISHTPIKGSSTKSENIVFKPSQKSVDDLRIKISQNKDFFETQKRATEEFLSDLKIQFSNNGNQVQTLSKTNQEMKEALSKLQIPGNYQEIDRFNDSSDGYLPKLSQIFIQSFSSRQQTDSIQSKISCKSLMEKYQLDTSLLSTDQCLKSWQLLQINSDLKHQIESIEGLKRERKTAAIIEEQHLVIENLVRSYVKERYLWEWVRNSINK